MYGLFVMSNQMKLLTKYLTEQGHEIHYLAVGYMGQVIKKAELTDGTEFNYKIYGQKGHQYFADQISEHLKKTNSDFFIVLLDTFMLHGDPRNPLNGWFLGIDTSPAHTMFWFPTDGGAGLPRGCELILQKINTPVAMARFGQKQVKDYHNIDAEHIPHGTEPDRYFKLNENKRIELRNKWGLNDKFVVGCVARNQGRKMLDREIKAFKLVAEKVPNAHLFLHMDPNDGASPYDLMDLVRRYNLENRVTFTKMNAMRAFDWKDMNEIYNVMDIFFMSTSGEGFGIPIIEAMACEIPVVCTSYTTTAELVEHQEAGYGVKLVGTDEVDLFEYNSKAYDDFKINGTLTGNWQVERGLMDVHDAAKKIIDLYNNPYNRQRMGQKGRQAVLKYYDFNKHVGPAFVKLMEKNE